MSAQRLKLPSIYPITDRTISGISHQEQITQLIESGAAFIQIRDKSSSSREFFKEVEGCLRLTRNAGAKLIVNDRVDIALLAGADGVHLGQNDLPPIEARKLLGDDAIIGFSTHTVKQSHTAKQLPIDYIAFGPIFITKSKADHDPVVGLDMLRRVRDEVGEIPLVAIGGINLENLDAVFAAGANSAAMISALIGEPGKIAENTKKAKEFGDNAR
jgi:thiamine-phosphate pyrophosphorylase